MTVSLVPGRAAGPTKAFRRNAQPAPARGCSTGVWGLAPNKRIEQSRPWRDAQFCRMGPILHRLPVSGPRPPAGERPLSFVSVSSDLEASFFCQFIHAYAQGNGNAIEGFYREIVSDLLTLYLTNEVMRKPCHLCQLRRGYTAFFAILSDVSAYYVIN